VTFTIAIATVLFVTIPQPPQPSTHEVAQLSLTSFHKDALLGFRYILNSPSLLALLICTASFWLAHDFGGALYTPMILARSGNNATVLGSIASVAGVGGVLGAFLISIWGGPKSRINGMLLGMIGAGLSKIIFGLGQQPLVWLPAQFCSSLNFPLLSSTSDAIWRSKVQPDIQGRVFAARSLVLLVTSSLGYLLSAPLADYVFEPAMQSGNWLATILGPVFGTGRGAGMAFLYVLASLCLVLVGLSGYALQNLRQVETVLPDHDVAA
jgi:DHA3 family macrolide efflux protein-like MFS transporter